MAVRIILFIALFLALIVGGMQRVGKALTNDLVRAIEKAHKGAPSSGHDAGPTVAVDHFPRHALRAPLDEDTLARMDRCSAVSAYDVTCRILSCRAALKRVRAELAVSVNFDGTMPDGTPVRVSPAWVVVQAEIVLENHRWRLARLDPIAR